MRPATTASMQSLLAQYFEMEPDEAAAVAIRMQAPQPQAAPAPAPEAAPALTLTEQLEAILPQLEALAPSARIPTPRADVPAPTPPAPEPTPPAPMPPVPSTPHVANDIAPMVPDDGWAVSAKAMIDTLVAENERLRHELKAEHDARRIAEAQADSDVLTPTLNRRAFLREMQRAMADCRRYGEHACLIYLDMDGFKAINDSYGHAAGDAALVYVAETLKASVREGDSVGRIGGDEFAILLRHADINSTRVKAMKLEAELALGTFEYKGLYLKTGGSFGVRVYADQPTAELWLAEADAAMFLVKKAAR
ncbi:GGDEF domain-containing protein [Asticcacaulis solisilvae]|uniref:GGDEF domain-containing protein n=1 Tax=Asticcacaulis solisilvae TaxID=1217274 RepID=UPI003FD8C35B